MNTEHTLQAKKKCLFWRFNFWAINVLINFQYYITKSFLEC
jgi:hypothetical protein